MSLLADAELGDVWRIRVLLWRSPLVSRAVFHEIVHQFQRNTRVSISSVSVPDTVPFTWRTSQAQPLTSPTPSPTPREADGNIQFHFVKASDVLPVWRDLLISRSPLAILGIHSGKLSATALTELEAKLEQTTARYPTVLVSRLLLFNSGMPSSYSDTTFTLEAKQASVEYFMCDFTGALLKAISGAIQLPVEKWHVLSSPLDDDDTANSRKRRNATGRTRKVMGDYHLLAQDPVAAAGHYSFAVEAARAAGDALWAAMAVLGQGLALYQAMIICGDTQGRADVSMTDRTDGPEESMIDTVMREIQQRRGLVFSIGLLRNADESAGLLAGSGFEGLAQQARRQEDAKVSFDNEVELLVYKIREALGVLYRHGAYHPLFAEISLALSRFLAHMGFKSLALEVVSKLPDQVRGSLGAGDLLALLCSVGEICRSLGSRRLFAFNLYRCAQLHFDQKNWPLSLATVTIAARWYSLPLKNAPASFTPSNDGDLDTLLLNCLPSLEESRKAAQELGCQPESLEFLRRYARNVSTWASSGVGRVSWPAVQSAILNLLLRCAEKLGDTNLTSWYSVVTTQLLHPVMDFRQQKMSIQTPTVRSTGGHPLPLPTGVTLLASGESKLVSTLGVPFFRATIGDKIYDACSLGGAYMSQCPSIPILLHISSSSTGSTDVGRRRDDVPKPSLSHSRSSTVFLFHPWKKTGGEADPIEREIWSVGETKLVTVAVKNPLQCNIVLDRTKLIIQGVHCDTTPVTVLLPPGDSTFDLNLIPRETGNVMVIGMEYAIARTAGRQLVIAPNLEFLNVIRHRNQAELERVMQECALLEGVVVEELPLLRLTIESYTRETVGQNEDAPRSEAVTPQTRAFDVSRNPQTPQRDDADVPIQVPIDLPSKWTALDSTSVPMKEGQVRILSVKMVNIGTIPVNWLKVDVLPLPGACPKKTASLFKPLLNTVRYFKKGGHQSQDLFQKLRSAYVEFKMVEMEESEDDEMDENIQIDPGVDIRLPIKVTAFSSTPGCVIQITYSEASDSLLFRTAKMPVNLRVDKSLAFRLGSPRIYPAVPYDTNALLTCISTSTSFSETTKRISAMAIENATEMIRYDNAMFLLLLELCNQSSSTFECFTENATTLTPGLVRGNETHIRWPILADVFPLGSVDGPELAKLISRRVRMQWRCGTGQKGILSLSYTPTLGTPSPPLDLLQYKDVVSSHDVRLSMEVTGANLTTQEDDDGIRLTYSTTLYSPLNVEVKVFGSSEEDRKDCSIIILPMLFPGSEGITLASNVLWTDSLERNFINQTSHPMHNICLLGTIPTTVLLAAVFISHSSAKVWCHCTTAAVLFEPSE